MGVEVGIDLGTTNSVLSVYNPKTGKADTILLEGKNTFPSVIAIRNGEVVAGHQAKSMLMVLPDDSIASTKRDIGSTVEYILGGRKMTPVDVACEILKAMKQKAEQQIKDVISGAIITVPAYFTSQQKEDTKKAAEKAGIKVLRLLPEPTAAAICYGLNQNKDQTIMVYDLGGGTFDVSILEVKGNEFNVKAIDGDSRLGGDDFDTAICKLLYDKIKEDTGIDLGVQKEKKFLKAKQKIKEEAEKAKIELSEKEDTDILIPNLLEDGYHLDFKLTRKQYYELIQPLLDKTVEKIKSVLKKAELTAEDIDRVVLVGGSTKSPRVKEIIKREIKDPFTAPNVDEVVSHGAAIMARGINTPDLEVHEIVNRSYGVNMLDENDKLYFRSIIKEGTIIPTKAGRLAYTARPHQEVVSVNVFETDGENQDIEKCKELGSGLSMKITKPSEDQIGFGIIFEMDLNGIIHFTGVELPENDATRKVLINSAINENLLDIAGVEKLIKENRVVYKEIFVNTKS